jgi:hypothetical protein
MFSIKKPKFRTPSVLTTVPSKISDRIKRVRLFFATKSKVDLVTAGIMIIGLIALLALIWFYVRPIRTVDIKVPVATDQSSYAPGEDIAGLFFGQTYYDGHVKILREVFCSNYKGVIAPPAASADGDFFSTIAKPRYLDGSTAPIGTLPSNVPIGSNCVLRFTNVYEIQTPFGIRKIVKEYYTQNFAIISVERRQLLDCEATGRKDCTILQNNGNINDLNDSKDEVTDSGVGGPRNTTIINPPATVVNPPANNTTNNYSTTENNTTAPPVQAPIEPTCTINLGIIKLGCN